MPERCLQIACVLDEISRARDFISEEAEQAGLDEREAYHCSLAVDEACTNIIEHGYHTKDLARSVIEICCTREAGALSITVSDDSAPFDPLIMPEPDPEALIDERSEGGWGIFFIKKFMDEVHYSFHHGRNILTMKKKAKHPFRLQNIAPLEEDNAPPFSLTQRSERVMLVVPFGRYDVRCASLLAEEITRLLNTGRVQFVMDLSRVTHITSGGMKLLVSIWHRVRERRGQLVLAAVPPTLHELFEVSGLDLIFTMVTTVEQAEKILKKRS